MPFPTVGSWYSPVHLYPGLPETITFVTTFVTGSSNVEYAFYHSAGTIPFLDYTQATNGSNVFSLPGVVDNDYKILFRLIGYPSLGFSPKVTSLSIGSGNTTAILQTINVGSDIQLPTSILTKAYVGLLGSYYWYCTGSVSSDAGSTWTPISYFDTEIELTSTAGSEPIIKIEDSTGSVVITKLVSYFHGSDIT